MIQRAIRPVGQQQAILVSDQGNEQLSERDGALFDRDLETQIEPVVLLRLRRVDDDMRVTGQSRVDGSILVSTMRTKSRCCKTGSASSTNRAASAPIKVVLPGTVVSSSSSEISSSTC